MLKNELTKEINIIESESNELDAMACSIVWLYLAKCIYCTMLECISAHELWTKLCNSYEKNMASNKVFLMQKLYSLQMKESPNVAAHLNNFDSLFAHICVQYINIDDQMKVVHLLCSFLLSWDTFYTRINNYIPNDHLAYNEISIALLAEEVRCKTMQSLHHNKVQYVQKEGRERRAHSCSCKGKNDDNKDDAKKGNQHGHSKSLDKGAKCHFCGRYSYMKKDCFARQW